jgi:hypothetical protein
MKSARGSKVGITKGEFKAMKAIYDTALELVTKPFVSKTFLDAGLEKHFFLCDFLEMTRLDFYVIPSEYTWRRITSLYQQSVSPTEYFGFYI